MMLNRRTVALAAAVVVAAILLTSSFRPTQIPEIPEISSGAADGSTLTFENIELSPNDTHPAVINAFKLLGDKIAELGEPQAGTPFLQPDVLRKLNATAFPGNMWEVSLGKNAGKAIVSEAGINYWANQIRKAHGEVTGAYAFAAKCVEVFNRENQEAVELLWGWKVALGTDYESKKNRCCRATWTTAAMRILAKEQPAKKMTAHFVEEVTSICTREMRSYCRLTALRP